MKVKSMNEHAIEQEIQAKGKTAARITPDQIDAMMGGVTVRTHVFEGTTTTIAVAFDTNGFSLATGLSACASPENFDREIGEKIATQNALTAAREELWRLEGYVLKKRLG